MLMNENVLEMTSKPSKTSSQWNSSVGNIKEITGGMLGSKSLFKAGQKQRSDAEFSRRQAQFQNYGDGLIDGFKAKVRSLFNVLISTF